MLVPEVNTADGEPLLRIQYAFLSRLTHTQRPKVNTGRPYPKPVDPKQTGRPLDPGRPHTGRPHTGRP